MSCEIVFELLGDNWSLAVDIYMIRHNPTNSIKKNVVVRTAENDRVYTCIDQWSAIVFYSLNGFLCVLRTTFDEWDEEGCCTLCDVDRGIYGGDRIYKCARSHGAFCGEDTYFFGACAVGCMLCCRDDDAKYFFCREVLGEEVLLDDAEGFG